MPAPALELRPRSALPLYDAALRLCARTSGVWALTLPSGAAMTWAFFHWVDAITRHRDALMPSLWLTLAWLFRVVSQGAACHYLEQQVLGPELPDTWRSLKLAVKRAPSLFIASAWCAVFNLLLTLMTLGLHNVLLASHQVAYAVVMRGEGSLLNLYGTCAKLLGPARHTAPWVRVAGLAQVLVFFNLHAVITAIVFIARNLLALELTFLDRFASLDNGAWVAALAALTFSLFEPLRAAVSTLLLIDGRVRQDGLDLQAQIDQLPRRKKTAGAVATAAALLLALVSGTAWAQADDWNGVWVPGLEPRDPSHESALQERLQAMVDECDLRERLPANQLEAAGKLSQRDQAAFSRFIARVERRVWDEEDCAGAETDLRRGLSLVADTAAEEQKEAARDDAKAILARPEFAIDPDKPKAETKTDAEEEAPGWFAKLWEDFWSAIANWLKSLKFDPPESKLEPKSSGVDLGLSNIVIVVAVALLLVLLIAAFFAWRKKDPDENELDADVTGLAESKLLTDPFSALARPPESWAGLADELAAKGQFREAIRHLYLALLSRLHRDGAIDYDPAKSNWDYFRGFKGSFTVLSPFKELTRRFDFAWYGNLEVSDLAWRTFRGICEPILADASAPREAARA